MTKETNNRLRFKAWDLINKTMSHVSGINDLHRDDNDPLKYIITDDYGNGVKEWKNIKLMESTGIKDINGKLIFEGYIVKEGNTNIQVIEWDDEYAGYGLHAKHYSYEVIGNIYQHKELLDDK